MHCENLILINANLCLLWPNFIQSGTIIQKGSAFLQNNPAPFYSFKYIRYNIIIPLTIKIWFLSSGRKVRLRHIRRGNEFPPISEDNNYDYSSQEYRRLQNPVTVHPVSSHNLWVLKIYCVSWCNLRAQYFIFLSDFGTVSCMQYSSVSLAKRWYILSSWLRSA